MPMIRLTETKDASALMRFCGDSLLGTYLLCRFCAYGNNYPFASCYLGFERDEICTAFSVLEKQVVLLATDKTDFEELSLLFSALGIQKVMMNATLAGRFSFPVAEIKQSFICSGVQQTPFAVNEAPLRDVYDLISSSIPGSFPVGNDAYLHFLSDYTFRNRRGLARLKAVVQDGETCACAITAAESSFGAVISGVACAERFRGRGLGKAVVCALAHDLMKENKTVHVIALNEPAGAFYRYIGFCDGIRVAWLKTI